MGPLHCPPDLNSSQEPEHFQEITPPAIIPGSSVPPLMALLRPSPWPPKDAAQARCRGLVGLFLQVFPGGVSCLHTSHSLGKELLMMPTRFLRCLPLSQTSAPTQGPTTNSCSAATSHLPRLPIANSAQPPGNLIANLLNRLQLARQDRGARAMLALGLEMALVECELGKAPASLRGSCSGITGPRAQHS